MSQDSQNIVRPKAPFRFKILIEGEEYSFTEVSGLDVETEIMESGHAAFSIHKIPKVKHLVFKRGVISTKGILFNMIESMDIHSRNLISIVVKLMDENGNELFTWKVQQAQLIKVDIEDYHSNENEIGVEKIEFTFEGITVLKKN